MSSVGGDGKILKCKETPFVFDRKEFLRQLNNPTVDLVDSDDEETFPSIHTVSKSKVKEKEVILLSDDEEHEVITIFDDSNGDSEEESDEDTEDEDELEHNCAISSNLKLNDSLLRQLHFDPISTLKNSNIDYMIQYSYPPMKLDKFLAKRLNKLIQTENINKNVRNKIIKKEKKVAISKKYAKKYRKKIK